MIKINNINTSNLDSIGLSQTSKGVLLKWNDKDYYYKSGSLHYGLFDKISHVVECICSKIREMLDIEGAKNTLQNINTKGSDEFEEKINQTLIFDFIVNNIDRHFNNFGYIINGEVKYCPIFDNGLSLYSDLGIEEIKIINKSKYNKKRYDKSKPFEKKHSSQIKLIKTLPRINLCNMNEEFINIIKEYESYLGKERVLAMSSLVEERLDYVRNLYADA